MVQIIVALIGILATVLSASPRQKAEGETGDSVSTRVDVIEKDIVAIKKSITRLERRILKHMLLDKSLTIQTRLDAGADYMALGGNGEGGTTYQWLQRQYTKHLDKTEEEIQRMEAKGNA